MARPRSSPSDPVGRAVERATVPVGRAVERASRAAERSLRAAEHMSRAAGRAADRASRSIARSDPAPKVTKGEQTRQSILEAAIVRFGRDGFRKTSVADIARDAGVGGTVTFAYFPNKEALFLDAIDEDAAAVIHEGLTIVLASATEPGSQDWRRTLIFTFAAAIEHHPLARRVLAGLEPEATLRVLELPALNDLRKACASLITAEQLTGKVRTDIDPAAIANGTIAIMLSLLMSVTQLGREAAAAYADDVAAVFEAALDVPAAVRGPRKVQA